MKTLIIYNQKSGSADLKKIQSAMADAGVTAEYLPISSRNLASKIKSAQIVVAAGGDGTINAVASHIVGTPKKLGILPAGTLNHFAKELLIPPTLEEAAKIIANGKARRVDVGEVNEHVFINNSSIGVYPRSLRIREEHQKTLGKWPAAVIGMLYGVFHPRHYHVELLVNGAKHTFRTPFVFIGNNEYKRSNLELGARHALDSGKLAVYIIKTTHPLKTIYALVRMFMTKKYRTHDFAVHLTDSCVIRTRSYKQLRVACDGEVFKMNTPLHFNSKHKALHVITN
jgi:diacylglycerol kinase family enzyme